HELSDGVMDTRASQMLLNFPEARPWYQPSQMMQSSGTYDYVIITTNLIKNSSTKLNDFKNYLMNKGHSTLVVTESDFDGLTGQYPNERQDRIRKWLQNNYIAYGIKYVLLIGDPDPYDGDIPMKRCWPRWYYTTYRESPTDYYYADLTGNWDRNGDGNYGYAGYGYPEDDGGPGGVDFMNEVYVGRIPVYSTWDSQWVSHLDSVLAKIINYGTSTNTAWRKSALLPMSFSDAQTDGAYLSEAMISDYLSPAGISPWKMYMQGSLCGAGADSVFSSNEELLNGATKTRWSNNPYGLVWWWGHGVDQYAQIGYGTCDAGNILYSGDASSLNNSYPAFVYQNSCLNGRPETPTNLGTALLYNGAIATVSASRVSWYMVGAWNTSFKYVGDNASIGYYYGLELVKNQKSAGEALYNVKSDIGVHGGEPTMERWMNLFDFNLYGDPATTLLSNSSPPGAISKIGIFRNGIWYLDYNGNGVWDAQDLAFPFGLSGDVPFVGDWNGSGTSKIGVFRNGVWYLDYNGNRVWDAQDLGFPFGLSGDVPIVGDWNGSGTSKIGVFRKGVWYLDYNGNGVWDAQDLAFPFGLSGDVPFVGDWNGSGTSKIGVFRNGVWYLDYNGNGVWDGEDLGFPFGLSGDVPIVGDWNGSGTSKIGVFRNGVWYLDYTGEGAWSTCGTTPDKDRCYAFGLSGDNPVAGNW
ncbi:MAG: C25 family cysteine peptidase, partial [Methanomicrobiales archaeon]|nr:C25 family cysteine peptidase [Methanomicrobiales archaeon]